MVAALANPLVKLGEALSILKQEPLLPTLQLTSLLKPHPSRISLKENLAKARLDRALG